MKKILCLSILLLIGSNLRAKPVGEELDKVIGATYTALENINQHLLNLGQKDTKFKIEEELGKKIMKALNEFKDYQLMN